MVLSKAKKAMILEATVTISPASTKLIYTLHCDKESFMFGCADPFLIVCRRHGSVNLARYMNSKPKRRKGHISSKQFFEIDYDLHVPLYTLYIRAVSFPFAIEFDQIEGIHF